MSLLGKDKPERDERICWAVRSAVMKHFAKKAGVLRIDGAAERLLAALGDEDDVEYTIDELSDADKREDVLAYGIELDDVRREAQRLAAGWPVKSNDSGDAWPEKWLYEFLMFGEPLYSVDRTIAVGIEAPVGTRGIQFVIFEAGDAKSKIARRWRGAGKKLWPVARGAPSIDVAINWSLGNGLERRIDLGLFSGEAAFLKLWDAVFDTVYEAYLGARRNRFDIAALEDRLRWLIKALEGETPASVAWHEAASRDDAGRRPRRSPGPTAETDSPSDRSIYEAIREDAKRFKMTLPAATWVIAKPSDVD